MIINKFTNINEDIISSKTNDNGTTSVKYTARRINILFFLSLIVGASVVYGFYPEKDSLLLCQESYIKATNEIVRYNENNPKYPISLPEYNCNKLINLISSGGYMNIGASSPSPERQEVEELTLRDRFGLGNCRFINEFHKLGKYNLEWMAYDIACEMGKSFEVRSPGEFKLSYKGYGANLGNYVILEKVANPDVKIVLGHIVNDDIQNTIYNYNDIIGTTDVSGASTNYHIHIELWDGYMNVSREFALGKEYKKLNGTALLNHRKWDFGQKPNTYYFTAYNLGDPNQNDGAPCTGASGKDLCAMEEKGIRTMALTSDIRNKMGIKFGDKVKLEGDDGCEGIFQVEDEMNKRFRQTPGILRPGTPYYIKGDLPSKKGGVCSVEKINK